MKSSTTPPANAAILTSRRVSTSAATWSHGARASPDLGTVSGVET